MKVLLWRRQSHVSDDTGHHIGWRQIYQQEEDRTQIYNISAGDKYTKGRLENK